MTLPTVHLNGTSARELFAQAEAAVNALRDAMRLMQESAPNGRDYYPQAAGAHHRAQDEHFARLARVRAVVEDYEMLLEHLATQMEARR